MDDLGYQPDDHFELFLKQLKEQDSKVWHWLIKKFRQKGVPLIRRRTSYIYLFSRQSHKLFIEEVFSESLVKFLELLPDGSFRSYSNVEAAFITIVGYKIKEGVAKYKLEKRFLNTEEDQLNWLVEHIKGEENEFDEQKMTLFADVLKAMAQLEEADQELLEKFYNGQELKDIAEELNIKPSACRKRKQRALEKVKAMILKSLNTILI